MHVIATAGHVDHGKSTLIRALTGMEPDRWAEERQRGMTIDLGYAWTTLPDGTELAFVDVPGHHRFISNMLAGAGPVPAALLVVAADEGWCRQTSEHLAALDVLGVEHGVLAITRSDLGDAELAEAEARDYLTGTSLAGIEAVSVSAVTGRGLDLLTAALGRMVGALHRPAPTAATRLWVDRVFTVRGAGTVLTGTLGTGRIAVGDELCLAPSGQTVRVRGLECLKRTVPEATAVARVAVNLRGLKPGGVRRGDALVEPGRWSQVGAVDVRLLRAPARLAERLVLHVGSAAVPVRARRLGTDTARVTLATPLPLHVGDRAVLRDPGEQHVVAGFVVLDTLVPPLRRRGAAAARARELDGMGAEPDPAGELRRRQVVRRSDLVRAGVLPPDAHPPDGAVVHADWMVHTDRWKQWSGDLLTHLDTWAAARPLSPGIPRDALARTLGLPDAKLLRILVSESPSVVEDGSGIHRTGVGPLFPPEVEAALDGVRRRLDAEPFGAPEVPELVAAGLTEAHLAAAVRSGLLIRVGSGVYLLPSAVPRAVRMLAALPQPFTLSEGRLALGTTRRVAMPLLEVLDRNGYTRRVDGTHREVHRVPE